MIKLLKIGVTSISALILSGAVQAAVPSKPSLPLSQTYVRYNTNYSVSWNAVAGATSYKLYENDVLVANGGSTSATRNHSSFGLRKYDVSACNSQGCGTKSEKRNVIIYTSPSLPQNVASSATNVTPGSSVSLSWGKANGLIDPGYYQVTQAKPNGSESQVCVVPQQVWSNVSFSCSIVLQEAGYHQLKVKACNESDLCSSSSQVVVNVQSPPPSSPAGLSAKAQIASPVYNGDSYAMIGESIVLQWGAAANTVSGANYVVTAGNRHVCTTSSLFCFDVAQSVGRVDYSVKACNPNGDCGGSAYASMTISSVTPRMKVGETLVTSQYHKYQLPDGLYYDRLFLSHYTVTAQTATSDTTISGLIDYGSFNFDQRTAPNKAFLTNEVYPAITATWTCQEKDGDKCIRSKFSTAQTEGCFYKGDKDPLYGPTHIDDYRHAQGQVYIPNFYLYVEYNPLPFTYDSVSKLFKVTVGNAIHEWVASDSDTGRWTMTNSYKNKYDGSNVIDGASWIRTTSYGYVSDHLNANVGRVNKEHFYFTEPQGSVLSSGQYQGLMVTTNSNSDHPDGAQSPNSSHVGTDVVWKTMEVNLRPWQLTPKSNGYENVYGVINVSSTDPALGSYSDTYMALNVAWPPEAPANAPNINSLVFISGGHISNINGETIHNGRCRTTLHSEKRGHSLMYLGAWRNGKFQNFVGVEYGYEGDGYPYMSNLYLESGK